jgi:phosphotransferase system enzyme I (PtsP)
LAGVKVFNEEELSQDRDGHGVRRPLGLEDFYAAAAASEKQLEELQTLIEETLSDVPALIFTAQILMLKDKPFLDKIVDFIKEGVYPPDAVHQTVGHYARMLKNLPNVYLQDKKEDVKDVGRRLLKNLMDGGRDGENFAGHIVVAQELFPSDIIKFSSQGAKGFLLLRGGSTSHNSILARSLRVPLMIVDHPVLLQLPEGTEVLMDADEGQVYILPSRAAKTEYEKRRRDQTEINAASGCVLGEIVTQDGAKVDVLANINLLNDLKAAKAFHAKGVGLYRTEFPFIVRSDFPSEEEQFVTYKKLVDGMDGREVTFRTLDIGGDKILSYFDYGKEKNPFLGLRSIRFSLRHREVFRQQLRAILRAGAGADLRIMFPMISSIEEFLEARQEARDCIRGLKDEGVLCHERPAVGMMVELPSVIEIIEDLAREADFFSIGTNDFIQYMLAVDRTNEKVADFYTAHHPSILRAFKRVVDAAKQAGKEVCVCGDMAHDPRFIAYFLGIGVRRFSLDTAYIPCVQKVVMSSTIAGAEKMAKQILMENKMDNINRTLINHA